MRRHGLVATLALVAITASCASERPAINRVQPNELQKEFFVGKDFVSIDDDPEFYMRTTLVDVGYGASQQILMPPFALSPARIKWEITEHTLNARLAYERIAGADGKGLPYNTVQKATTGTKCYRPSSLPDGGTADEICKPNNDGQVVAVYRIASHFDVKRAYNPTTGEPLNVIEENTSDRPWQEREYFRVDWSQNLATAMWDFDLLALMGLADNIQYEPISYTITDPTHPDAPHFEIENDYFDVTFKAFAKPQMVSFPEFGITGVPSCFFAPYLRGGTWPNGNCNSSELTWRSSFMKVVDHDYEPLDYDGVRRQAFGGISRATRMEFDYRYGITDDRYFRFMERYNIWERSHYYADPDHMTGAVECATWDSTVVNGGADPTADPNRDLDGNGTADECEAVTAAPPNAGGSRCDTFNHKCTLPYTARTTKTIPMYFSNGDDDLFQATDQALTEWDVAMKSAAQVARLVDCRRTGGSGCESMYPVWTGQHDDFIEAVRLAVEVRECERKHGWGAAQCTTLLDNLVAEMVSERSASSDPAAVTNANAIGAVLEMPHIFVLCHNPVLGSDHAACGPVGRAIRLGDLRYHQITSMDAPLSSSPWGVMFPMGDPLTGEIVAASNNVFSQTTARAAQGLVDMVKVVNGEISPQDITEGKYIHNFVQAQKNGAGGLAGKTMTKEEVQRRVASVARLTPDKFQQALAAGTAKSKATGAAQFRQLQREGVAVDRRVPSAAQASTRARLDQVRGTPLETQLMNGPMLQAARLSEVPTGGLALSLGSPLAMNNPKFAAELQRRYEAAYRKLGIEVENAPEPTGLTGFAEILKRKFPAADNETKAQAYARHEAMYRYVRRLFTRTVIMHEMGHGMGLEHNFVSSAGPMYYWPQYWQLRTRNGSVTAECTDAVADGATCVGPRYFDPVTDEEQSQMIWLFGQGSVMDYPGDQTMDFLGLSVYDPAAIRFLYTENVAVYSAPDIAADTAKGQAMAGLADTFGGLTGILYQGAYGEQIHYSQLQGSFGLIHGCFPVTPKQPSWWRDEVDGKWDALVDGHYVKVDGAYTQCRQMPVDYAAWRDGQANPADVAGPGTVVRAKGPTVFPQPDGTTRMRVPYHYAHDQWTNTGNAGVWWHDSGADVYEQVNFVLNTMENNHIWDAYRRNRTSFDVRLVADRIFERYNSKLTGMVSGVAFYRRWVESWITQTGFSLDNQWSWFLDDYLKTNAVAATVTFDALTRQLSRPEDGEHFKLPAGYGDPVHRSMRDPDSLIDADVAMIIPTGTTGLFKDVAFGGHPLENALDESQGDYAVDYPLTAGSYYDKINTFILLAESEDRFVSQSRGDFYDARYRANGLADLFPDGFRRIVANVLTNDRSLLGMRVAADAAGKPLLDAEKYPSQPMGWTSWWPSAGPSVCFSSAGRSVCEDFSGDNFDPNLPATTALVDPQIGWETQKFAIAWTLAYISQNWQSQWIDMMKLHRVGAESPPVLETRIEWEDPTSGDLYYAQTYGKECLFGTGDVCTGGTIVQKGIAARVLEWANALTGKAYLLDTAACPATANYPAGYSCYGRPCFVRQPDDGRPIIVSDPWIQGGNPTCNQSETPDCTPLTTGDNRYAYELRMYKSVADFLWESMIRFGWGDPHELGVYP